LFEKDKDIICLYQGYDDGAFIPRAS